MEWGIASSRKMTIPTLILGLGEFCHHEGSLRHQLSVQTDYHGMAMLMTLMNTATTTTMTMMITMLTMIMVLINDDDDDG